jgi:glycosyltransferase involved in cell wall biosynthesis
MISRRHLDKLHLVRNGIDASRFSSSDKDQLRSDLNLPQDVPLIGMAAHIIPWKNHDVFIESAALIHEKMPEVQFALFGRDLFNENKRYLKQLKALVVERGLKECFYWKDNCSSPEEFIPALDILIHPPRYEPFGRIICEAMVCGVPVIAADSAGPATIITDRLNGRLAVDGLAHQFAEIAIELLQNPPACKAITSNARKHILANYTTERVCRDLIKVYDNVIRKASEDRNFSPDND